MGIIKWLLLTPLTLKIRQYFYGHYTWSRFHKSLRMQLDKLLSVLQPSVRRTAIELVHYHHNLLVGKNRLLTILVYTGFANFIDKWSHCDFCFTNFGVILEYLESSITTKKTIFRLSSTWSWHVYTIMRDTRSSFGGPLTWKA